MPPSLMIDTFILYHKTHSKHTAYRGMFTIQSCLLYGRREKRTETSGLYFFVKGFKALGTDICFGLNFDGNDLVLFLNEEILLEGGFFASVL